MTNNKLSVTLSSQLVSQINSGYAARTLEDDTVTLSRYIQEILSHWYFMRSDKPSLQITTSNASGTPVGASGVVVFSPPADARALQEERPPAVRTGGTIAGQLVGGGRSSFFAKYQKPLEPDEEPPFDKSKCQHEERYSAPNDEPGMDYCAQCSLLVPKEAK